MTEILEFLQKRKRYTNEYFASTGSKKTVLICSHVWWTELMAHALLKLGYNVLVAEPWYLLWLDDSKLLHADKIFSQWVQTLKKFGVQLVIGGNSTAVAPHPKTKELLHRAAGVPAVHYWWDEPRAIPPISRRGVSVYDYINALRDPRTLNVIWDGDVCEELRRFLSMDNVVHIPLGTTPMLWDSPGAAVRPSRDRPMKLCFLGNHQDDSELLARSDPKVVEWAGQVVEVKLANPDRPMPDCVENIGGPGEKRGNSIRRPYELAHNLKEEFERWNILNALLARRVRTPFIQAAARALGADFTLIGKGWDKIGLSASKDSSGVPGSKDYYGSAKASLNLTGGSTHSGLSLRPYEIACSRGLVFTRYNRELPGLFEPGNECIAFKTPDEMTESLDRIVQTPDEHDAIIEAGRGRVIAEHTWEHRLRRVLQLAKERFGLPW